LNLRPGMESNERSLIPIRVAGVTAALAGTGAVFGAGLSAGFVALAGAVSKLAGMPLLHPASVFTTAGLGAGLGAVLIPMTALSLLRRVALGKALLFTMLGMAAGVVGGQLATGQVAVAAGAGFGAFMLVALLLRMRSGNPAKA